MGGWSESLILRWQKALWELVDETGMAQPMSAVSQRAGFTDQEAPIACALAMVAGVTHKLPAGCPGRLYDYFPTGER